MSVLLMFFCLLVSPRGPRRVYVACTWTLPGLAVAHRFPLQLVVEGLKRFRNTEQVSQVAVISTEMEVCLNSKLHSCQRLAQKCP